MWLAVWKFVKWFFREVDDHKCDCEECQWYRAIR